MLIATPCPAASLAMTESGYSRYYLDSSHLCVCVTQNSLESYNRHLLGIYPFA
ncbi:hypothetical protein HCCG_01622 [Helicobacter cinaedi CCUG 18818 = ATCC BAA-847]|uniref:Uncharacterized protein n=1 Tax=Helicobacter cinaedi CCUG 18818 = ATCC BAA-847 TaxID=537971 RepID=A0ABN0BE87_9HELI|nr:hypothetical protein HCCG_01622 [Helicobacter cinaedi CCUG 18818 = ATCC BAA-847]